MANAKQIILPIGLPSLQIAWLALPLPMTQGDYEFLISTLANCREALVEQPAVIEPRRSE
jgi:hypothetical protein